MINSYVYKKYNSEVVPMMIKKLNFKNIHQVPSIIKISLSMGLGEAIQNPKIVEEATQQMGVISGQKAIITKAKKSIAAFKLREKMPIGCMVTLRREKMWCFMDRLINIAIPRIRDFRGISPKAFDGYGNYTMGIQEQLIFPEINYDKIDKIRGLNITFVTSTFSDKFSKDMFESLGFPFRK